MIKFSGLFNGTRLADKIKSILHKKEEVKVKKKETIGMTHSDITSYSKEGTRFEVIDGDVTKLIRYFEKDKNEWSPWKIVNLKDEDIRNR